MNLRKASVIGFFSLPSPSMAEYNPVGYSLAMQSAPEGAGSCAQCGMGIIHHVVIRTEDGKTAFIGSDCAIKIGGEVAKQTRSRLTADQIAERNAKRDAQIKADRAEEETNKLNTISRWESVKQLVVNLIGSDLEQAWFQDFLNGKAANHGNFSTDLYGSVVNTNQFHHAMAAALIQDRLTERMAYCTAKLILGRRVKKNAEEFDTLCETLVSIRATA
jgi:hypothetical protein